MKSIKPMNKKMTKVDIQHWRRLAEDRLAEGRAKSTDLPEDADSMRALHELLVHQVELELQNEELLEARTELEANEQLFIELYDFAPVGYFSLSADGRIRQLNLTAARLLGRERSYLLDHGFLDFVSSEHQRLLRAFLARIFAGEPAEPCELQVFRLNEPPVIVRLTGVLSPNGLVCRIAAMDVTRLRQAETEARQQNEDLDRIFNLSPDLIGIATQDGRFVRVNPAFEKLLGHPLDELTSRTFLDYVHPDDRQATEQAMCELRAGREVLDFVNRYRCLDGTYRSLEWRANAFPEKLIFALARDVTARKQAEEAMRISEKKFRSIVEAMPMAMYLYRLEEDGRLILFGANPAADKETGIDHESLYGKTLEEAFPGLVGTDIPDMYRGVASGALDTRSFVIRYDDGRIAGCFDVRVFQTSPGTIVVAFMDISERMKVEDELRLAHEELELRVQRRTAQLQERTRQLRALANELIQVEERERRRIAGLIHDDLQQTLVAISLRLRMLKEQADAGKLATDLNDIGQMLGDSIAMSRSLTTELSPPVLQQRGLAAAFRWLKGRCMEQYGLNVDLEIVEDINPGPEVAVVLFRAVRELLLNIVKHAGVKSAKLRLSYTEDGRAEIEVSDEGAGFDPEEVRAHEGAIGGFGLFNIRERLEMLGGGLATESSPGCGSRITLWVPLTSESGVDDVCQQSVSTEDIVASLQRHARMAGFAEPQAGMESSA
jgi:PAS domain S-box-containing protein